MNERLSIGEFSAMTHLSVKTLRRYHDSGLLVPSDVDDWTRYRYYAPQQIPTAQTIRRLRELDMPIRDIAALLSISDENHRHELLTAHLRRLEAQLDRTREAVSALRNLLALGPDIVVERREVPDMLVAAITAVLDHADVEDWFPAALIELHEVASATGQVPIGPAGAIISNTIYAEDRGEVSLYLPIELDAAVGRVRPMVVPAAELAVTTHHGSHADIDVTYGRLGSWVLSQGYAKPGRTGHVRQIRLIGRPTSADENEWRTEIAWPLTVA